MTIKHKIVPVDLFTGIDTDTDPKMSGGSVLKAENVSYRRNKVLSKRYGFDTLPGTHLGEYLARHKDQVVMHGSNDKIQTMESSTVFYIACNAGKIFKFDGETFTALSSGTAQNLYDCHGVSENDVWFVGGHWTDPQLRHYDGSGFTNYASPVAQEIHHVYAVSTDEVYALTNERNLLKWDGASWAVAAYYGIAPLQGLWHDGSVLHVIRSGLGYSFFGTWNGAAWSWDTSESYILSGIHGSSASNVYVAPCGIMLDNYPSILKGSFGDFSIDDRAIQDSQANGFRCLWVNSETGEVYYTFYKYGGGGINGVRMRSTSGTWSTILEVGGDRQYGTIRGATNKVFACCHDGYYIYGEGATLVEYRQPDTAANHNSCVGFERIAKAKFIDDTSPYSDEIAYLDGEILDTRYESGWPYHRIDSAQNGNIRVLAALGTQLVHYGRIATYSLETGALLDYVSFISSGANLYAPTSIRAISTDSRLFVFFVKSADTGTSYQIYYRKIDVTTGEIGAETLLDAGIADVFTIYAIDACYLGGTEEYVGIVYLSNQSGAVKPYILFFQGDVSSVSGDVSGLGTVCTNLACYSMGTDPEEINLVYVDEVGGNTLIKVKGFLTDHTQAAAEATMGTITGTSKNVTNLVGVVTGADTSRVYWNYRAATTFGWQCEVSFNEYAAGAATHGSYKTLDARGVLQAKPFTGSDTDTVYLVVIPSDGGGDYETRLAWKHIILKHVGNSATIAFLAGKLLDGRAAVNFQVSGMQEIGTIKEFALSRDYVDTWGAVIARLRLDVDSIEGFGKTCESRDHLLLPGLMPRIYDGQQCVEQGFAYYPYAVDAQLSGNPGSGMTAGLYGYVALYEWYDSQGNLHRSAPSPVSSVTQPATPEDVDVLVPPLCITEKNDVRVVIYRTKVDGDIYYRLTALANTSGATVSYTDDTISDASLTPDGLDNAKEYIYTDSGEIENIQANGFRVHCVHQDRHVVAPMEQQGDLIQYSKKFGDWLGVEHCGDNLQLWVPPNGGNITALASHQNQLIIFKGDRTYYTYGSGLDALGKGTEYKDPALLSSGVGCPNQRTLVHTPLGLVFQAQNKNFYLIDTRFQLQPMGDPVSWYAGNYDVTEGVLLSYEDCVVWFTDGGPAMVWNYSYQKWSTWVIDGTACVVNADEQLVFKSANGDRVMRQNRGSFVDNVTDSIALLVETSWIEASGQSIHCRKRMLHGYKKGNFSLGIKQAYNFDPHWKDTKTSSIGSDLKTWDLDDLMGAGLDSTHQHHSFTLEFDGSKHKCGGLRFQIYDDGSTNEALELTGLSLELALRPTRYRVGSGRRL